VSYSCLSSSPLSPPPPHTTCSLNSRGSIEGSGTLITPPPENKRIVRYWPHSPTGMTLSGAIRSLSHPSLASPFALTPSSLSHQTVDTGEERFLRNQRKE
jgi:hypothetical protein